MDKAPAQNTPSLAGWLIAAGLALVAVGVGMVVFRLSVPQATGVAALIFLVSGLILGQPSRPPAAAPRTATETQSAPVAAPATVASLAAAPAVPAAAAASAPAAPMDIPAAETRPEGLAAPRGGKADDLKEIEGIGPAMEKLCQELGFFHYDQIAGWSAAEIAWVDANLKGFKGRVTRDRWVAQAKIIVAEGLAAFRERAKTNDY